VIADYGSIEYPEDENGTLLNDIIHFQVRLAKEHDSGRYTLGSVLEDSEG